MCIVCYLIKYILICTSNLTGLYISSCTLNMSYNNFLFSVISSMAKWTTLLELITFNVSSHRTRNPEILSIPTHRFSYLIYSGMSRILRTGNHNMALDIFNSSRNAIKNHFFRKLGA